MQRTNLRNVICLPELVSATRGEGGRDAAVTGAAGPACVCTCRVRVHLISYFYLVHMNSK